MNEGRAVVVSENIIQLSAL